jgi:hypothetical protein
MSKLIVNVETNEEIVRELNAEEIAQQEIDSVNFAAKLEAEKAEAEAKAAAKAALLERLGITQEEANLLLG